MKLNGKVALVTGAAGNGLGRSIALTLAREGASVIVNYRNSAEKARQIVEHILAEGGKAAAVQGDIFTQEGCQQLASTAIQHFGQIDICVIGPGGEFDVQPIEKTDTDAALKNMHDETAPIFYMMRATLPSMYERGWGRLIGISSHPDKLSPSFTYNAGKMARMQTLLLAVDEAWKHGVTINVIAPGPVLPTNNFDEAVGLSEHNSNWQNRKNVTPQDIAEAIAFLCSEEANYISGTVIPFLFH